MRRHIHVQALVKDIKEIAADMGKAYHLQADGMFHPNEEWLDHQFAKFQENHKAMLKSIKELYDIYNAVKAEHDAANQKDQEVN